MANLPFETPRWMDNEVQLTRDSVDRFFQREIPLSVVELWRERGYGDVEVWKKAGAAGLLGVSIPVEYGGAGGDFRHDAAIIESQIKNTAEGFGVQLHNVIVAPYVLRYGSEEQRRRWLPRLCAGELIAAIAMSEPGAGSDLKAIKTKAERVPGGYRLNGSKIFISNGYLSNFIVVVAKTDPSAGHKGVSLFILETENAEGFRRGKLLDKIGNRASDTAELFFDDVFIPEENLLGLEEGRGFYQLMEELPKERLGASIAGVNVMEMAIEMTAAYTKEREVFGKKLFEMQNTQFKLAECYAKARLARTFVDDCIERATAGTLDNITSATAKMWVTEAQWEVVDACLQLHGGYGYINEYPIAHLFRNSRISRIYGGSSEVMKIIIARAL